jgi:hypothetical protein
MTLAVDGREYVTGEEYVQVTPLSEKTVRRRIRDGSIESWQPGGPGTKILIPTSAFRRGNGRTFRPPRSPQIQPIAIVKQLSQSPRNVQGADGGGRRK